MSKIKSKVAFTLIELLVVITVINILGSIILVSANTARQKARLVRRVTDIRTIQKALELYNLRNDSYPDTGMQKFSECAGGFTTQPKNQWIPNLVSEGYLRFLPTDPFMASNQPASCYAYQSNGTNYKLMLYQILDIGGVLNQTEYLSQPQLIDPRRDGGSDLCSIDYNQVSPSIFAWAIYTRGTTQPPCNIW